jgi:purine-binding chemotaxis protein CheW
MAGIVAAPAAAGRRRHGGGNDGPPGRFFHHRPSARGRRLAVEAHAGSRMGALPEHALNAVTNLPNPTETAVHASAREYLSFKLGAEEYGIDILRVQEIRGYEPPTRIANAPSFIKGVVNLRGVIVPIVDMRVRFSLEDVQYNSFTVVIILNITGRTVGMVVDSVSDVLELKAESIRAAPEFNGTVDATYITGIGDVQTGDTTRMLILMDIERLMQSPDMGLTDIG